MKSTERALDILFSLLLALYPPSIRRRYGSELRQTWDAVLAEAVQNGRRHVLRAVTRAALDVIWSAAVERARDSQPLLGRMVPVALMGLTVGACGGYIHARSDADPLLILAVVGFPMVTGLFRPAVAPHAAVVLGAAATLVQFALMHGGDSGRMQSDVDHLLMAPLLLAWVAAMLGSTVGTVAVPALHTLYPPTRRNPPR